METQSQIFYLQEYFNELALWVNFMSKIVNQIQVTKEGLDELQAELEQLQTVDLPKVVNRVAVARAHGDLSENAEYSNAKEEQQLIESRIAEVEDILQRAVVVRNTKNTDKVGVGSTVTTQIKGNDKHYTFHIVGEYEGDPKEGKVSSVSPIGKALMAKKKGDEAKVEAPAGDVIYIIKDIK